MIRSIKHKGLRRFHQNGNTAGIQAKHAKKLRKQLTRLNNAEEIGDMDVPGYDLHSLKGDRSDIWSISVSDNWRSTFKFQDANAYIVDYEDYH